MKQNQILIVEDESIVALEIEAALERLGYAVCGRVTFGEDAVAEAGKNKPDLILMDVNLMGKMDGIEAAGIIRDQLDIPVVYLTAYTNEDTIQRAKLTQPLGFLEKPFKEDSLRIALEMAFYTAGIEASRKEVTNRLQVSEQRYQDMFNSMIDGYAVHEMLFDEEGKPYDYRFLNINPAFETFTGLKADDIIGKTVMEVLPNTEKSWLEKYGNVVVTGQPLRFSNYSVDLDKHFDVSAYRIGFSLFACSFVDDTIRKKAEEKLALELKINAALAEISTKLISSDKNIQSVVNLILEQSLSITGSRYGLTTIIDPQSRESVYYTHSSVRSNGQIRELTADADPEKGILTLSDLEGVFGEQPYFSNQPIGDLYLKDLLGGCISVDNFLSVPVFLDGRISGYILLANRNVDYSEDSLKTVEQIGELYALAIQRFRIATEREVMQEQMRQMQKMEAIGTLAGGIAHDFNNILQPIMGYANMLLKSIDKTENNHKYLSSILKASMRARDLVQQILTFARANEQILQPVEIRLVAKEVARLLRSSLPSTIEIKLKIAKDCGLIMADPTKIHQVLMNLATNSFHALQGKGGTLKISLKTVRLTEEELSDVELISGDYISLIVADDGAGIEPKILNKIFDPYFTTKPQSKGTGLGLSVVMGIIKSYGGFIKVKSELGHGTEFNIFLPEIRDEPMEIEPEEELPIVTGNERILLVDDEPAIAELMKSMLLELGYEVVERNSGLEALELFKAQSNNFDLILTDMTMPSITGAELARDILAMQPDMPIILCTGFSELINEEKAASIGIRKLLMKPVSQIQLANNVREVLDQKASLN